MIHDSGLGYSIVRPTVIFGREDILINNIAFLLRRVPFFAMPGSGDYRVTPVFVADIADLAMELGIRDDDVAVDALGPETYTFDELVRLIARAIGKRARIVHVPAAITVLIGRLMGLLVRDVILTRDEAGALMAGLLNTPGPRTGETSFSDWLERNAESLGATYESELKRHFR
jgi:NADH dehydrogenase